MIHVDAFTHGMPRGQILRDIGQVDEVVMVGGMHPQYVLLLHQLPIDQQTGTGGACYTSKALSTVFWKILKVFPFGPVYLFGTT